MFPEIASAFPFQLNRNTTSRKQGRVRHGAVSQGRGTACFVYWVLGDQLSQLKSPLLCSPIVYGFAFVLTPSERTHARAHGCPHAHFDCAFLQK